MLVFNAFKPLLRKLLMSSEAQPPEPIKARFFVQSGTHRVTDVGCRVKILRLLLESTLDRGTARNVPKENKVEVIVQGPKEDIINFRERVQELEIPGISLNPGFVVTELEFSKEIDSTHLPEINRVANSLMLEQLDKSIDAFLDLKNELKSGFESLPDRIAQALKKILKE